MEDDLDKAVDELDRLKAKSYDHWPSEAVRVGLMTKRGLDIAEVDAEVRSLRRKRDELRRDLGRYGRWDDYYS